ncbi:component of the polarisome [Serendipita sp. 396]|nr:component of the polarisome [Serendipita sp. 396]KAG8788940.1 component of the polarisome [Serendipita sp. 397]KAG8817656.1 component of the polarisome [Serendipita sp. 400]KAG8876874.1 component of the polarisome [Serendipita sp. 405]
MSDISWSTGSSKPIDYKSTARTYMGEFRLFLSTYNLTEVPESRVRAREKLTRLTRQQLGELSLDAYDEVVRRKLNPEVIYLPAQDHFHPKRNQARQKLSTLPKARLQDLVSDVYFELGRRYLELKEIEGSSDVSDSGYGELPLGDKSTASTQYKEFQLFLSTYNLTGAFKLRASTRQELTRLTRQQFEELSTDAYDEIIRRKFNTGEPYLPTRDDFHPKRNQARQKLSTLPKPTLQDLVSDVYFELRRQYPELKGIEAPKDIVDPGYGDLSMDDRTIARMHFKEFQLFLSAYNLTKALNSRANARERLTRLTRQQFRELSTDAYDEVVRRKSTNEAPYLPSRDDLHPKRNQARQKLSTLANPRLQDLASDVHFELGRRYPELKELEDIPDSGYGEFPQDFEPNHAASGTGQNHNPEQGQLEGIKGGMTSNGIGNNNNHSTVRRRVGYFFSGH